MVLYVLLNLFAPMDWVMIFGAILLLFGGKKIPELMKGLGQGIKEFKDASKGTTDKDSAGKEGEDSKGQLK